MSRIITLIFIVISLLIFVPSVALGQTANIEKSTGPADASKTQQGKSVAFVVGINSYSNGWDYYSNGVGNAQKIAEALEKNGFTVFKVYDKDATLAKITDELLQAAKEAGNNGHFIFYYSGQGYMRSSAYSVVQSGYIVPVDAPRGNMSEYITTTQIYDYILIHCQPKNVMVFLDTNFAGRLTVSKKAQSEKETLFTKVLSEGLGGAADSDNNGKVDFKELQSYIELNANDPENSYLTYNDSKSGEKYLEYSLSEITVFAKKIVDDVQQDKDDSSRGDRETDGRDLTEKIEKKMEEKINPKEIMDKEHRPPIPRPFTSLE